MKKLSVLLILGFSNYVWAQEMPRKQYNPQQTAFLKQFLHQLKAPYHPKKIEKRIRNYVENNADLNVIDIFAPESILEIAFRIKDQPFLIFLVRNGLDINKRDKDGNSLLAKYVSDTRKVRMLIAAGANPHVKTPQGISLLQLVIQESPLSMLETVNELIKHAVVLDEMPEKGNYFPLAKQLVRAGVTYFNNEGKLPLDITRDMTDRKKVILLKRVSPKLEKLP